MRATVLAIPLAAAALAFAACGGDDAPERRAPPESAGPAAAELEYCVEGAGALAAKPGEEIPELGEARAGPEVEDATQALVVYWADTGHSVNVYFAPDAGAAERAADELANGDVRAKGSAVAVPDDEHPPTSDEALLVDDCMP